MTTTVVKTIGATGDYSTLQAWEDACPANLVTVDQIWQGQCQNQEFSGASAMLTIGGMVTDTTRYVELTTVAGASFADHANKLTNALRYNAANGAAIKTTGAWGITLTVTGAINVKISKLQIAQTKSGSGATVTVQLGSTSVVEIDRCIIEGYNGASPGVLGAAGSHKIKNSLVVQLATSGVAKVAVLGQGAAAYNSIFASIGAVATAGLTGNYGTTTLQNCYVGGCTAVTSGSTTWAITTSHTSVSGPPSGWSATAPLSTATFQNVTSGTHDFRTLTGSALIDAGTTDAANAPTDIVGTTRSGSWDVGVWEFASAGGADATAPAANVTGTSTISAPDATGGSGTTGSFTFPAGENNSHSGALNNVSVNWAWHSGGAVGAASVITNGSGTMTTVGMTISGLPTGPGYGVLRSLDGTVVGYREGTVS